MGVPALVAIALLGVLPSSASAAAPGCAPFGGTMTDDTTMTTPRAGMRELTEYLANGGYRVTTCPRDDAAPVTTEVHPFATATAGTLYRPTVETRAVAPGVWRVISASYAVDGAGVVRPPSDPAPAPRPAERARLAPVPRALARGQLSARATLPDDSCSNGTFSRGPGRWPNRVSRWQSRRRTYPAEATTLNRIARGFAGWETTRDSCGFRDQPNIDAVYDGESPVGWHSVADRHSVVDFGPVARLPYPCNQRDVLACTTHFVGPGNALLEADLRFNAAQPWVHSGQASGYDVTSVATHEAGHWLIDLDDLYCTCNAWMTMYGTSRRGLTRERTLARGDVRGMRSAYP